MSLLYPFRRRLCWTGTKEIKFFVRRWVAENQDNLRGKVVVDVPAGNGYSSGLLTKAGAFVKAFDFFPAFFREDGLNCEWANLGDRIPLEDGSVDYLLCQEGIEHIPDQVRAFKEFNRVLKEGGKLVITTPNYSNIRSRLSYLLGESEFYGRIPAPNEFDSIWFAPAKTKENSSTEFYFGHVFLVGIQKLRFFGKINGFEIHEIYPTRVNNTSLLFFLFFYPFIFLVNCKIYRKMRRNFGMRGRKTSMETFLLGIHPKILLDNHLFVIFEKKHGVEQTKRLLAEAVIEARKEATGANISAEAFIT